MVGKLEKYHGPVDKNGTPNGHGKILDENGAVIYEGSVKDGESMVMERTITQMAIGMKVNLKVGKNMAREFLIITTELNGMKVSGKMINSMVMERTISKMAICMKVSGKMGKGMVMERTITKMAICIKVGGKMIKSMARENYFTRAITQVELVTLKVNLKMGNCMARDEWFFQMDQQQWVDSKTINSLKNIRLGQALRTRQVFFYPLQSL